MLEFMNAKNGGGFAPLPVVVVYTKDLRELYRYFEYPAIYHKDRVQGHQQAARPGESEAPRKERDAREILSALYERHILGGR